MHARALDQLHDARYEHILAVADRIHFDLFAEDVVVNQHRLVRVDLHSRLEIVAKLRLIGDNLHGHTAEHETRTHEHRIADFFRGAYTVLDVGHRPALRLRNAELFENLFKHVAVLRVVDRAHVRADDAHAALVERCGKVDRRLSAERRDHVFGALVVQHVHDVLRRQRLKVELVGGGVVGGNRFGIVVDDDGFVPRLADRRDGVHGRVVEFHTLSDADRSRAEHDGLFAVGHDGLVRARVGGVEVRNIGVRVAGVHHLEEGEDVFRQTHLPDGRLRHIPALRNVFIGEADLLGLPQHGSVRGIVADRPLKFDDLFDLLQEVRRDGSDFEDFVHADAHAEQLRNRIDVVVAEFGNIVKQLFCRLAVKFRHIEVAHADLQRTHRFQQAFFERAADAHDLARRFHLRAELVARGGEFVEREPRELGHHIVERRFKGGVGIGNLDILQQHTHGDLGRHAGDRIAAGLGRERGGTRHAGVDLDQKIFARFRMQRELHVAAALDLQGADNLDGAALQHVEVVVVERHDRRHNDGVARMHADRVDVFHTADRDGVVGAVAHDLELDLLIALDALLDQHLMHRRKTECLCTRFAKLFFVVGKTAARAAERKRRTQHHGVADRLGGLDRFVHAVCDARRDDRLADLLAQLLEQLSVLGTFDAAAVCAQQLHTALVEYAALLQLDGEIQSCLTADAGDDRVRPLQTQNTRDVFRRQRLHVYLVRNGRVCHDGRRIGIDEDDLVPFLAQGETRLRTRVVKFRRLSDHDGTGADDHNFFDVRSLCHIDASLYPNAFVAVGNLSAAERQHAFSENCFARKGRCPAHGEEFVRVDFVLCR